MKFTLAILISILALNCKAQIKLTWYKCMYEDGQWPNTMAEMYLKNDTFEFDLVGRDISSVENNDEYKGYKGPDKELKVGLDLCFYGYHYFKTKDSIYISTGRYRDSTYYYKVYIPDKQASLSVRSNINDNDFADKSKWLLSQIRLHRKAEIYLINDKNETCQIPPDDK